MQGLFLPKFVSRIPLFTAAAQKHQSNQSALTTLSRKKKFHFFQGFYKAETEKFEKTP